MFRLSTLTGIILLSMASMLFTACSSSSKVDTNTTIEDNATTSGGNNDDNSTAGGDDDNTITLKSLTLTVDKQTLNRDENTTLKVIATYSDNSTKDITDQVTWITIPSDSTKITNTTLTALQDKATTLKAKLNNTLSNEINLAITWTVNGHTLPPAPDKALNDSTLLGIDVNNNNVRDDVERWIYDKYKDKHPIHIDIGMQAGRAYKLVLETPERAKEIHKTVSSSLSCEAYYQIYAKYFNEPLLVNQDVVTKYFRKKIYFNTTERKRTYLQYDKLLSGDTYTLPKLKEKKALCDFNVTKYEE